MKFETYRQLLLAAVVSIPLFSVAAPAPVLVVETEPGTAPLGPDAQPTPVVPAGVEDSEFGNILERPLFDPSRRPPPPAVVSTVVPTKKRGASTPPDLKLLGIVTADGLKNAIIKTGKRGGSRVVAVGEELEGWLIQAITRNAIELEKAGETHKIELQRRGSSSPAGSDAAASQMMPPGMDMDVP